MDAHDQTLQIHIAFDTNRVWIADAENRLISDAVGQVILETNKLGHPRVSWYLLDLVRAERRYQMSQAAQKLVAQANKVGALLGRDFNITSDTLMAGIDSVIASEIQRYGLTLLTLDHSRVNWKGIIDQSISRAPPFSEGASEKGFRDAIVLETFSQFVDEVSQTGGYKRFILVTEDKRLNEALGIRYGDIDRISAADKISVVHNIINAYAVDITESDLRAILGKADSLFYNSENGGLFSNLGVESRIREAFQSLLSEGPPDPTFDLAAVTARLFSIGPVTFVDKKEDRWAPRKIAPTSRAPQNCLRMIRLCSRSDS